MAEGAPHHSAVDQASGASAGGADPAVPQNNNTPRRRRRWRRRRVGAAVAAGLVVLVGLVGGGAWLIHARQFVSTDNAQIDADQIHINAPATGTLVEWRAILGAQVTRDEIVGRIKLPGSGVQPQQPIRAPETGTIAEANVVDGQWVTAGTNLAVAYNTNAKIYATARVDETDIKNVHVGAPVDIDVDAFSGLPVTGIVQEIQPAAAGVFSLFPESNSTGNFQKVTQVIPVKIALLDTRGLPLVPGMNITAHIHKPS